VRADTKCRPAPVSGGGPAVAAEACDHPGMRTVQLGVLLWNQATDWPSYLESVRLVDRLGYAHLWAWDHLYAIFGDPYQPIFEGWGSLAAAAGATERTRLGLLVGANTFRNPGLVAKQAATLDHLSGGRAVLGLGGAWFGLEHEAHGIDFGSGFGERLDWLDESVAACRAILDGETVTSAPDAHYRFRDLHQAPLPVQPRLPIMIGGSGERKTLRTVARYADLWNAMGPVDVMARKVEVLRGHCEAVGRDPAEIEFTLGVKVTIRDSEAEAVRVWHAAMAHNRTPLANVAEDGTFWNGTPEQLAERLAPYLELGFRTVITEQPAPYDTETLERFIGQVKPLVERG
jgi:alkanesulfonate monooxygenase SsuD/methylene tetrahydromethanopterin reductase-like flavin-dependent oxidoreductase (luciferase family)